MLKRFLCVGLLSLAICGSSFGTSRFVPSATYPTLLSAYNASSNGDIIYILSAISSAGFTISKNISIESSSPVDMRQITLTSTTPFTSNYSSVHFVRIKIIGQYNGTCIKINAGKSLSLINCELSGSALYAIRDMGSRSTHYETVKINGAYTGLYGTNMSMITMVGGGNQFNNIYRNIYSSKSAAGLTGHWISGASMTAGYYSSANNFRGFNTIPAEPSYVLFEGCLFNAVTGSSAYPLYFTGNHDINIMGGTFNPCPNTAWYRASGTVNINDGATHINCPVPR